MNERCEALSPETKPAFLEAKNVSRYFKVRKKGGVFEKRVSLKAVDGVFFSMKKKDAFGLVGESGSGKSTLAKVILNIVSPTAGTVLFKGEDVSGASPAKWRGLRRQMQYVFQDPLGALDPRMKMVDQVAEPLVIHGLASRSESREKAAETLLALDLKSHIHGRYPHELSGGQRQRVVLARALILKPELLVCDEPISALDVSIQAQVINLLIDLKQKMGLTLIFISHDLSVVRHVCQEVAVMYLGKIIERAKGDELFAEPAHPYTRALISAIPIPEPDLKKKRVYVKGEPPSPIEPPSGCPFHPRCPVCGPDCSRVAPELKPGSDGRMVACHKVHGER